MATPEPGIQWGGLGEDEGGARPLISGDQPGGPPLPGFLRACVVWFSSPRPPPVAEHPSRGWGWGVAKNRIKTALDISPMVVLGLHVLFASMC